MERSQRSSSRNFWFLIAAAAVVSLMMVLGFCAYSRVRLIASLASYAERPEQVSIEWSATSHKSPTDDHDYIHVKIPNWVDSLFSGTAKRLVAAPFCCINEVRLYNADSKVLDDLCRCKSLKALSLKKLRNMPRYGWERVLRLPLESFTTIDSGLPGNALTILADRKTIKELRLASVGPFDENGAAALGVCGQLENLYLEEVSGLPDKDLAVAFSRLERLKHIELRGKEFGEQTVFALRALPALEEVWLVNTDLRSDVYAGLSECERLSTVGISNSKFDESVLASFSTLKSLKRCFLEENSLTETKIREFRQQRPDVTLRILRGFNSVFGQEESTD